MTSRTAETDQSMEKSISHVTEEDETRESFEVDECDFSIPETKNATPEWIATVKAILRGNIEDVKVLIANGYPDDPKNDDHVTDVSLIGVASYASLEMFDTIYAACPESLERARYDMWNPLCIAITKNDKQVLSRLMELVKNPLRASQHSRAIIMRSEIPEVVEFVRANYSREIESFESSKNNDSHFIHPQMSSTLDSNFVDASTSADEWNDVDDSLLPHNSTFNDEDKMHKYKFNRPPDLEITKDDLIENSEAASSKTPIIYPCETPPPAATILDVEQQKMAIVLQRFGLKRFIFTFLTQEVDLDLFLTLGEQDLWEIGIQNKSDRIVLLSVIEECNRYHL